MKAETGDKVRMKAERHCGARGIIEAVHDGTLVVRLDGSGQTVKATAQEVTNYSLAARRAWKTEPNRGVGRPKGMRFCDRVSVTLRIDRDLWERFQAGEANGLIEDRTAVVNACLREKLAELKRAERRR